MIKAENRVGSDVSHLQSQIFGITEKSEVIAAKAVTQTGRPGEYYARASAVSL